MGRLLAVAVLGLAAACGQGATPAAPTDRTSPGPSSAVELTLDFEHLPVAVGEAVPAVMDAATGGLVSRVVTLFGGEVTLTGGAGAGYGLRFPAFRDAVDPPAAVLVVQPEAGQLAPGPRGFRFGADFALDALSAGDGVDDGDNLVQRGLFDDDQYKIQLDGRVPACRVSGRDGNGFVEAADAVRVGRWYRVTCTRQDNLLTLRVEDLVTTSAVESQLTVATGVVRPEDRVPLTVGGKVGADGRIAASATDQFNGSVDNVFYELVG